MASEVRRIDPDTLRRLVEVAEGGQAAHQAPQATNRGGKESKASQGTAAPPGDDFKRVNEAALNNLDAWVQDLLPAAKRSAQGWRVSSKALGRNLQEDLSLSRGGIVDFGLADQGDARGGARTAIDVVMEWGGHAKLVDALRWLAARLGIPLAGRSKPEGRRSVPAGGGKGPTLGASAPEAPPGDSAPPFQKGAIAEGVISDELEPDRFIESASGVYLDMGKYQDGKSKPPLRLTLVPLRVVATVSDRRGAAWQAEVTFRDRRNNERRVYLPYAMLQAGGKEAVSHLGAMGLYYNPNHAAKLAEYLATRRPDLHRVSWDRCGFDESKRIFCGGAAYIEAAAGEGAGAHVFLGDRGNPPPIETRGTLQGWQDSIGRLAVGNPYLILAICIALAAPLLDHAGAENGAMCLIGNAGAGKTTTLRVGVTVFYRPAGLASLRATDNGAEALFSMLNYLPAYLDELGQHDPATYGMLLYLIGNGQIKLRALRAGGSREVISFRLLALISGELSTAQHAATANKKTREGQHIRAPELLGDDEIHGAFADLHGMEAEEFAKHLQSAGQREYGTVGRAWVRWILDQGDEMAPRLRADMARFLAEWVPESAHRQVHRVAHRFALIAAAGELAIGAGLLPWPKGEAARGLKVCFNRWLGGRGFLGGGESYRALEQARTWLAMNHSLRFESVKRLDDDRAPRTGNSAGFYIDVRDPVGELETREYLVFIDVFRNEVAAGFNAAMVGKILVDREHAEPQGGRYDRHDSIAGMGKFRCVRLKSSILNDMGEDL